MRGQIIPLTIVMLFLFGTLASAAPATTSQIDAAEGALNNEGPNGPDKLQGVWQDKNEVHRLYLVDGADTSYGNKGCRVGNTADANHRTQALWTPPQTIVGVPTVNSGTAGSITFKIADTTNSFTLNRLQAHLEIGSGGDADVVVELMDGATILATTTLQFTGGGLADAPVIEGETRTRATAVVVDETSPVAVATGANLGLRVRGVSGGADTIATSLHYNCNNYPSNLELFGNTAAINVWTEDDFGRATDSFPTAQSAPSEDRRIHVWAAHINALGSDKQNQQRLNTPGMMDLDTTSMVTSDEMRQILASTTPVDNGGMELRHWVFQYRNDLVMDDGAGNPVPYDGPVKVQFAPGGGQLWRATHEVAIGGAAVQLDLAPFEVATKTVLVGQKTSFQMLLKNGGLVQDDVIISAGNVDGWQIDVNVDSADLGAGQTRLFPVTITPPPGALAGDFKSLDITAVSGRTGRTDTQTVTVILTNLETDGVDILASQLSTVKLAPGRDTTVGLTVKNLGNSGEDFVLSTAGAPLGWKATLMPSSMSLGGLSQSGTLLKVIAPADAKQGDKFALAVTVRSVVDNSIKDTLLVPVEIFFQEKFSLTVLDRVDDTTGLFTAAQPTLAHVAAGGDAITKSAPGIHLMRDEGRDGVVYGAGGGCPVTGNLPVLCAQSTPSGPFSGEATQDPDIDYDQSTLFRVQITNQGQRADSIRLDPAFVNKDLVRAEGLELLDGNECENNGGADGIPDGWRFRYWAADGPAPTNGLDFQDNNPHDLALSGLEKSIPLAAGETKFVWVELGWRAPARLDGPDDGTGSSCPVTDQAGPNGQRSSAPSKNAIVKFTATSSNDQTKVEEIYLRAHLDRNPALGRAGSQRYDGQVPEVFIGIDNAKYSNQQGIGAKNSMLANGGTASYFLRAVNAGTEMDLVRIQLPTDTDQFSYKFGSRQYDGMSMNLVRDNDGTRYAPFAECTAPGSNSFIDCRMGVYDEVRFEVQVTAKAAGNVPIGLVHNFQVTATSMDSLQAVGGAATDGVKLQATATGTHAFTISKPVVPANGIYDVNVVAGKSIKVPFTISNIGTSFDDYNVDLIESPSQASGWDAIFSFNSPQFVAAGKDHIGFLNILAPSGAAVGTTETFRIRVQSLDGTGVPDRTVRVQANIVAATTGIDLVADPAEAIGQAGGEVDLKFVATRTSGGATQVTFTALTGDLPEGWTISTPTTVAKDFSLTTGKAEHTFKLNVPADAIGSSRVPITVTATDSNTRTTSAQVVVSLDSALTGVHLSSPEDFEAEEIKANIVSGSSSQVQVRVQNLAGGIDAIKLTHEALPSGWSVSFSEGNPEGASFQPFEARTVTVTVHAPEGVPAGQGIDIILKATSEADATSTDTLVLAMRTGQSDLLVSTPVSPTRYVAPLESSTFAFTVRNNGTVRDEVTFGAGLSAAYKDLVQVTFKPTKANLGAGESVTVTASVSVPEAFLANSVIPIKLQADSDGPFLNAFGESSVELRVLDHRKFDIDTDGNLEFAVDRDRDASNGFEQFIDPVAGGKVSRSVDMARFLTEAAIVDWTVIVTENNVTFDRFNWIFDLTGDGRIDHFVDVNQDNLPDIFWNPSTGGRDDLDTTYDVTQDGVREYFVDVDGDNQLDVWYDITTGKVGQLLKVDVDGDGIIDFVVDLDGDGQQDAGEPVLFGKNGKISKITQSVDVNGDGKLDLVVDEDGDGVPDFFVPNGKTRGVQIVLEDVTGDGVEDWTYDANNDGRRDSYYNPVTGETGSIDTNSQFAEGLAKYWYVPTLFALVTVLFVVLVVVTRR